MAQICAETLGVDYASVRVVHGQTDRIERGLGAFASRVTVMTGEATRRASLVLRDKLLRAAAGLMQTSADQLVLADGVIRHAAGAGATMTVGEVAAAMARTSSSSGERAFAEASFEFEPHGLSLRRPRRAGPRRPADRPGQGRALSGRLRHRPRGQSDAGGRADHRRRGAGARRRALRGVPLRRAAASRCR